MCTPSLDFFSFVAHCENRGLETEYVLPLGTFDSRNDTLATSVKLVAKHIANLARKNDMARSMPCTWVS